VHRRFKKRELEIINKGNCCHKWQPTTTLKEREKERKKKEKKKKKREKKKEKRKGKRKRRKKEEKKKEREKKKREERKKGKKKPKGGGPFGFENRREQRTGRRREDETGDGDQLRRRGLVFSNWTR
jgi:hypothetical protein